MTSRINVDEIVAGTANAVTVADDLIVTGTLSASGGFGGTAYIPGGTDVAVADGGTGASTAADARTNLGLGTIATQSAASVAITGGSITGITDLAVADGGTGASTAAGARTNLDVPSNSEAILDTIIDAKGDLIVGSAADTPARLAVGSNDSVLTADSAEATGVKWAALSSLGGVPSGSVLPYAGSTEPSGWLFCYGQAISRTTYAALFTVISTTYGVGDGSTTFNLPDLRGRVVAGQDDMGGASANRLTNASGGLDGDTLGATGGAETHTLSAGEMPSHTHSVTINSSNNNSAGSTTSNVVWEIVDNPTSSTIDVTTGSAGSGTAHNNVQPTIILNYIIKT